MVVLEGRVLLHLQGGRRIPVGPQEIYPAIRLANCGAGDPAGP
jgi:hypothetical protein